MPIPEWTTEPDVSGRPQRLRYYEGNPSNYRTKRTKNQRVALRTPTEINKDAVSDIASKLTSAGVSVYDYFQTSNPFIGERFMKAFRYSDLPRVIELLENCGYDTWFVERAAYRWHPHGSAGYLVVAEKDSDTEWPPQ
jgi:hypothetical protein